MRLAKRGASNAGWGVSGLPILICIRLLQRAALLLFLLLHCSAFAQSTKAKAILSTGTIDGFALGLHHTGAGISHAQMIDEIADTGARWVSLVLPFYQEDFESVQMGLEDPRSPRFVEVEAAMVAAREAGLRTMVFPLVLLQDDGGNHWRGDLRPRNSAQWFENYGTLLVGLAKMAERQGVEIFSVGSEFTSLQKEGSAWSKVIGQVREVFSGACLYSANWDAYEGLPFLAELEFIGVSSYFELTKNRQPSVGELMASWRGIRHELLEWQDGHSLPMLFTELGYASVDGCAAAPWDYLLDTGVDLEEQRVCFEAFVEIWGDEERLAGTLVYEWFGAGGVADKGYTPKGKPALEVIQRWLERPEALRNVPAKESLRRSDGF